MIAIVFSATDEPGDAVLPGLMILLDDVVHGR